MALQLNASCSTDRVIIRRRLDRLHCTLLNSHLATRTFELATQQVTSLGWQIWTHRAYCKLYVGTLQFPERHLPTLASPLVEGLRRTWGLSPPTPRQFARKADITRVEVFFTSLSPLVARVRTWRRIVQKLDISGRTEMNNNCVYFETKICYKSNVTADASLNDKLINKLILQ